MTRRYSRTLIAGLGLGACTKAATSAPPATAAMPAMPAPASSPAGGAPAQSALVAGPTRAVFMTRAVMKNGTPGDFMRFQPLMAAVDTGGECNLSRSDGSGATTVRATFPSTADRKAMVTIVFDSAGHIARYLEQRGFPPRLHFDGSVAPAQRDSAMRAAILSTPSTLIQLDYPIDRASVANEGEGGPPDGLLGTVRAVESLPQLGPVTARIERVRRLCGV